MDASLDGDMSQTILGHCDFDHDLVSRIIVSEAYSLYYLRSESQIWCVDSSSDGRMVHTIWVTLTLTLTSDLISRFSDLARISFITNNFPQMCLMLDLFLLGHSSGYCAIS